MNEDLVKTVKEFVIARKSDIDLDMENFGMLKPVLDFALTKKDFGLTKEKTPNRPKEFCVSCVWLHPISKICYLMRFQGRCKYFER